jgi:HEPN domain-containing protein
MSNLVAEWVAKAEGDYATALREYRARKRPNYDAAGFHAQQCVEKYMKALLQKHGQAFEKVHDLLALLELSVEFALELELHRRELAYLTRFAVAFRYPGESATKEQAQGRWRL